MLGKVSILGSVLFVMFLLSAFVFVSETISSAEYNVSSTTMNVTIRGFVAISASTCVTNGITFSTIDPETWGNNASCNNASANGGTAYNLTVDPSSNTNVNFTQATNGSLIAGAYSIGVGNITYNSNSSANNGTNLPSNTTATALQATNFDPLEDCGTVSSGGNCYITYFLDVPDSTQEPGNYETKYCWCGRQTGQSDALCGTCT